MLDTCIQQQMSFKVCWIQVRTASLMSYSSTPGLRYVYFQNILRCVLISYVQGNPERMPEVLHAQTFARSMDRGAMLIVVVRTVEQAGCVASQFGQRLTKAAEFHVSCRGTCRNNSPAALPRRAVIGRSSKFQGKRRPTLASCLDSSHFHASFHESIVYFNRLPCLCDMNLHALTFEPLHSLIWNT